MTNAYSREWYETFLDSIPSEATASECAFIERQLPLDAFPRLLDLCCGPGRHAARLSARGYRVHGIDANPDAIARARAACPRATFEVRDMRSLRALGAAFDGVLSLWHSFGYFDDAANRDVLKQLAAVLRPGGRAVLDVYNLEHFAGRPEVEVAERAGRRIRTTRSWDGKRHRIALAYDGREGDHFEWRLYAPHELRAVCAAAGLRTLAECAWFDEARRPAPEHARMQLVLERAP